MILQNKCIPILQQCGLLLLPSHCYKNYYDFYVIDKPHVADSYSSTTKVIYTHWGRIDCPSHATVLYEGFVAGTMYKDESGTSSLLCLPNKPEYVQSEAVGAYSSLYSTEYQTRNAVFTGDTEDYDVPCAMCISPQGSATVMLPATPNCPSGLNTEYRGYLMSERNEGSGHPTETICVDDYPETLMGSSDNENGALLFFVAASCNYSFMPCGPYKHLVPLSCAVCSY